MLRLRWSSKGCMGGLLLSASLFGQAMAQGASGSRAASEVVASGQVTGAPVQDDLFAGTEKFAKGASEVNEVTMDPDTLDLVNGKDARRAHNMLLNVVRSYEYEKPGMYRQEDVEEFRKKLSTGDWHCSVHVRELKSGSSTDICSKRRTDGLSETAIITAEPKQLTFIHRISKGGSGASLQLPDVGGRMKDLVPELTMLGPTLGALRPEMEAEIRAAQVEVAANRVEMSKAFAAGVSELDLPEVDARALDQRLKVLLQRQRDDGSQVVRQP